MCFLALESRWTPWGGGARKTCGQETHTTAAYNCRRGDVTCAKVPHEKGKGRLCREGERERLYRHRPSLSHPGNRIPPPLSTKPDRPRRPCRPPALSNDLGPKHTRTLSSAARRASESRQQQQGTHPRAPSRHFVPSLPPDLVALPPPGTRLHPLLPLRSLHLKRLSTAPPREGEEAKMEGREKEAGAGTGGERRVRGGEEEVGGERRGGGGGGEGEQKEEEEAGAKLQRRACQCAHSVGASSSLGTSGT
eukprot:2966410-Rhodomonas_salina.3